MRITKIIILTIIISSNSYAINNISPANQLPIDSSNSSSINKPTAEKNNNVDLDFLNLNGHTLPDITSHNQKKSAEKSSTQNTSQTETPITTETTLPKTEAPKTPAVTENVPSLPDLPDLELPTSNKTNISNNSAPKIITQKPAAPPITTETTLPKAETPKVPAVTENVPSLPDLPDLELPATNKTNTTTSATSSPKIITQKPAAPPITTETTLPKTEAPKTPAVTSNVPSLPDLPDLALPTSNKTNTTTSATSSPKIITQKPAAPPITTETTLPKTEAPKTPAVTSNVPSLPDLPDLALPTSNKTNISNNSAPKITTQTPAAPPRTTETTLPKAETPKVPAVTENVPKLPTLPDLELPTSNKTNISNNSAPKITTQTPAAPPRTTETTLPKAETPKVPAVTENVPKLPAPDDTIINKSVSTTTPIAIKETVNQTSSATETDTSSNLFSQTLPNEPNSNNLSEPLKQSDISNKKQELERYYSAAYLNNINSLQTNNFLSNNSSYYPYNQSLAPNNYNSSFPIFYNRRSNNIYGGFENLPFLDTNKNLIEQSNIAPLRPPKAHLSDNYQPPQVIPVPPKELLKSIDRNINKPNDNTKNLSTNSITKENTQNISINENQNTSNTYQQSNLSVNNVNTSDFPVIIKKEPLKYNYEKTTPIDHSATNLNDPAHQLFVKNETHMLLLPNDDVSLGEHTKEEEFSNTDFLTYAEKFITHHQDSYILNNLIRKKENTKFINTYYKKKARPITATISFNNAKKAAFLAISNNDLEALRTLLNYYPLLQATDMNGNNLLHHAVRMNNYSISKMLIMKGINTNLLNNEHETPIAISLRNNSCNITNLIKTSPKKKRKRLNCKR